MKAEPWLVARCNRFSFTIKQNFFNYIFYIYIAQETEVYQQSMHNTQEAYVKSADLSVLLSAVLSVIERNVLIV